MRRSVLVPLMLLIVTAVCLVVSTVFAADGGFSVNAGETSPDFLSDKRSAGNGGALVAYAGDDQTVPEKAFVQLNGSASGGAEGPITYQWSHIGGPRVKFDPATIANPGFTAPDVGPANDTLMLRLTVTDRTGASASDTVRIDIINDGPGDDDGCFISTIFE